MKTLGGEAKDVGVDVLLSAAARAANADSRRQMREDGAAVLSKAANSRPVTAANEKFDKLLDVIEANVDKDKIQQQVQRYIDAAQAMANDTNFRAGFDETPYGPRHVPPASAEDFLSDQEIKELTAILDAEKTVTSLQNRQSIQPNDWSTFDLDTILDDIVFGEISNKNNIVQLQRNLSNNKRYTYQSDAARNYPVGSNATAHALQKKKLMNNRR